MWQGKVSGLFLIYTQKEQLLQFFCLSRFLLDISSDIIAVRAPTPTYSEFNPVLL